MIFPNEPLYVVNGLGVLNGETGNCGFAVGLRPDIAKRFYGREVTGKEFDCINTVGKEIVTSFFKAGSYMDKPYFFIRNEKGNRTLLLQSCQTVGKACDLAIDGAELERVKKFDKFTMENLVEYSPHNVDSKMQALSLFNLWNKWVISAYATTSKITD
ncbi:MAG TPA: hypothetical protein VJZ93_03785 [Candidatus Nanoarchaeia archaeon]|nr:hypothetical protein [Candidatus Nanoarchaeia archaeon]